MNSILQNKLFEDMPIEILKKFCSDNDIYFKEYSKGVTVHNVGAECNTLDIIIDGEIVAYSLHENGNSVIMFTFSKGNILGANLLFADKNRYPLNIYCQTDCKIAHIKRDTVENMLEVKSFRMRFIYSISNNSFMLNQKMLSFSQKNLRDRILKYLEQESIRQASKVIKLSISKKQMADLFGVQRPSLFRELKAMRDEEIIEYNAREISLLK